MKKIIKSLKLDQLITIIIIIASCSDNPAGPSKVNVSFLPLSVGNKWVLTHEQSTIVLEIISKAQMHWPDGIERNTYKIKENRDGLISYEYYAISDNYIIMGERDDSQGLNGNYIISMSNLLPREMKADELQSLPEVIVVAGTFRYYENDGYAYADGIGPVAFEIFGGTWEGYIFYELTYYRLKH